MQREYHTIAAHRLQTRALYHQPGQNLERVRIDSPTLAVMTDLRQIPAATIEIEAVRGIFSASQIARQLGVAIQITEVAQTFAKIGTVLGR